MATYQNTENIELSEMESHLPQRPIPTGLQRDSRWIHPSTVQISDSEQPRQGHARRDPRRAFRRDSSGRLPPNRTVLSRNPMLRAQAASVNNGNCLRQNSVEKCVLFFVLLLGLVLLVFIMIVSFYLLMKMQ